ncbi:c-type cytochrome [Bacillus sp. HMF5848]|uniref:cytochrome c551 n=1 Tax=Bacillus sp. HMF5848 TaxID=2495421 RepID=UPI000F773715|nr:cytochrome c [Bacillus sp. HMF5848]RSK28601.1 c-type cytochrome [Bacillus sp. HMF5848]
MKKKLLALLMGTSLVLAACGGGGEEPADNAASSGGDSGAATVAADVEKVYQRSCVGCHGQNLEGGVGPALTATGANLSQDEIESIIVNGKGGMPGNLVSGEDAAALAAWLAEKK